MNLRDYWALVEARFTEGGGHLRCIEIQLRELASPHSAAWEWTRWDEAGMPDGSIAALRTTVSIGERRGDSYAACALFDGIEWREVTRLEAMGLATVKAFEHVRIAALRGPDLQEERFQAAFLRDAARVQLKALRALTVFHLSQEMRSGENGCHP